MPVDPAEAVESWAELGTWLAGRWSQQAQKAVAPPAGSEPANLVYEGIGLAVDSAIRIASTFLTTLAYSQLPTTDELHTSNFDFTRTGAGVRLLVLDGDLVAASGRTIPRASVKMPTELPPDVTRFDFSAPMTGLAIGIYSGVVRVLDKGTGQPPPVPDKASNVPDATIPHPPITVRLKV